MARRKKPNIGGKDPAYSHTFEKLKPLPTNMPDDVVIPGVDREPETSQTTEPVAKATKKPATVKERKAVKPLETEPETKDQAERPKTKLTSKANTEKRRVDLAAAIKVSQLKAMEPLIERGIEQKDIIALAGKRTTTQFEPKPKFQPVPEADRAPMREAFRTTKPIPTPIIEKLRKENDPLGVKSDGAMLRGQFEPLFWAMLDQVIEELREQYT